MDPLWALVLGPKAQSYYPQPWRNSLNGFVPISKSPDWLIFMTQATNKRCSKFGFGPLLLEVYS